MSITYTFNEDTDLEIIDSEYPQEKHIIYRKDRTDDQLKDWGRLTLATHFSQENIILNTNSMRDDVYMNGTLGRSDYTIGSSEGQAIKTKLEASWPSEVADYECNELNLVSEYGADREPYVNDSISWYCFDEKPDSVISDFSLSTNTDDFREWWGLKFDKVTLNVLCKAVYTWNGFIANKREDMIVPPLPFWMWDKQSGRAITAAGGLTNVYVAMIHDKNGNIDEHYDLYFQAPQSLVKEWCDDNDIAFNVLTDINNIMQYGITIKGTTGEVKYVKTYKRFFV